jgi:hypothetical protein
MQYRPSHYGEGEEGEAKTAQKKYYCAVII